MRDRAVVDTHVARSVSFAPPEAPNPDHRARPRSDTPVNPVGPGQIALPLPLFVSPDEGPEVNGYPVQPVKVQRPPVRDDTLARERLLDWLHAKIHHRVILVVAEAGYGKTTLLADFSRRTRMRTLWYRLDEDDTSWIAFVAHLVAAGREHDRGFAPATGGLLGEMTVGSGPSRETAVEALVRDFGALGDAGAVVVLDDYHLVDDQPEIRATVQRLLAAVPERVSFVFASRRQPGLALARLRAQGEVAELTTDDLRFDAAETERLFRESYGRPLEPDVLDDLNRRTEGWAASLQLVQAALRDQSPTEIRASIRTLSGAEGDLHDYLAEEVVGNLPERTQAFLMRTSLLQAVDPDLAELVTGLSADEVAVELRTLERMGLLTRSRSRASGHRYHPLVQQFLQHRLASEIGDEAVAGLHETVATRLRRTDWRRALHHYLAAGRTSEALEVVETSLSKIMGVGAYDVVESIRSFASTPPQSAAVQVLLSREALRGGRVADAVRHATQARDLGPSDVTALMNLLSVRYMSGDFTGVEDAVREIDERGDPLVRAMALALRHVAGTAIDYDLHRSADELMSLAAELRAHAYSHYEAVALLNAANVYRAIGDAEACLAASTGALDLLSSSPPGAEMASAHLVRGWALAHLGRLDEARQDARSADEGLTGSNRAEYLVESGEVELWYGDIARAEIAFSGAAAQPDSPSGPLIRVSMLQLHIRSGNLSAAATTVKEVAFGIPNSYPGLLSRQLVVNAHLLVATQDPSARHELAAAIAHSEAQGADFWAAYGRIVAASAEGGGAMSRLILLLPHGLRPLLSVQAEAVTAVFAGLKDEALQVVTTEALARPTRWLDTLRAAVAQGGPSARQAARLLDQIGSAEDVLLLRRFAKSPAAKRSESGLGRGLARRLAPIVAVRDLGRVSLEVNGNVLPGADVRRRVLGLLCFLLTRPQFSATRDEVLDALWPDLDPNVALNSLNQTIYFLRRILEPSYAEELSPGYVHHDSDVIWLDPELVISASGRAASSIGLARISQDPAAVDRVLEAYTGKFALDFAYEEWAAAYRETLHAAFLSVVEEAIRRDTEAGRYEHGIELARRTLEIDRDAEEVEVSLLRLYRASGSHAAAAEQYGHYASMLRADLGVDPPPLDSF